MFAFQHRISNQGWALLPVRVMVGFGFAAHGIAKLNRGPEHFAALLAAIGVPAPSLMAWTTCIVELVGGIAILAGVFVLAWSLPLAIVMVTAMFSVHFPYGYSSIKLQAFSAAGAEFGKPGYELNLLYLAGLSSLVLGGPGAASIDGRRLGRRMTAGSAMLRRSRVATPARSAPPSS